MTDLKKNIWILGGAGFIGTALVKQLSSNPANLLHLLVHKNIPYRTLENFNIFTGSLQHFDYTWLEKYPPDIIFHMARIGGSNSVTRYLAAEKGANANQRLINFLINLKSAPAIVYVSGSLMYGHQYSGKQAGEDSDLLPISYARYYIHAERPWIEAQYKQLLDIRFARPGWIMGPYSWFRIFYWNSYLQTGKIPIYGGGQQFMSVVQVDDCAGQIINLAENGKKYQNLNIFAGAPITQQTFVETLARLLKTTIELKSLRKYGSTVVEAFISSIPLKTNFPQLFERYQYEYPNLESMLLKTLSALKHEQSILAKFPQKSFIQK
jgi:nucleoside-diphosphate-sugar epimerase